MKPETDGPARALVAYLILSHTLPRQVLRLASLLRRASPRAVLLSHHDARSAPLDGERLAELGVLSVEPPSAVAWGEFSQLHAVLRCLRFALGGPSFDWLVVISGQDYPIRPLADIERSLALAEADALIETTPCEPPPWLRAPDEFSPRYFFRWRRLPPLMPAALVRAAGARGRLAAIRTMPSGSFAGVRALRTPFAPAFRCRRGADWFTLSRAAVEAVCGFAERRGDVVSHYRRTLHPNESFIQTVLANDPSLRVHADTRRYSEWDSAHMTGPRVLTIADLDRVLRSGGDFARKFADRAVLDEIDRRVHLRV